MTHFPDWFIAVCILLPIGNFIYRKWKNNKRK